MGGQTKPADTPELDLGAIVDRLLTDDRLTKLIAEKVVVVIGTEDFGATIAKHVDAGIDGKAPLLLAELVERTAPGLIVAAVDERLPDLAEKSVGAVLNDDAFGKRLDERIAAAMPETDEQRAARMADEEQDRQRSRDRADKRAAKDRAAAARDKAETRSKAETVATHYFRELGLDRGTREPIDLTSVARAKMLIDNGERVSIDFERMIDPADLSLDDGDRVVLRHKAIDIGEGVPSQFTVHGVLLVLDTAQVEGARPRSVRCELTSPLVVGAGATAQIGADSLVFRDR